MKDGARTAPALTNTQHEGGLTYGYDCCDPSASQIDSKGRQSIYFILGGVVQDRHVVALDKACVLQALLESAQKLLVLRYRGEEPDHRHRLLRTRRERLGCNSTTKNCNEVSPPHGAFPQAEGTAYHIA